MPQSEFTTHHVAMANPDKLAGISVPRTISR
jgi:hypothetical protein